MVDLSELETKVINVLWRRGPSTVDDITRALPGRKKLKDSTVRTILGRMEKKGFVAHDAEGRTNVYRAVLEPQRVAMSGIRDILDRFLGGSVEALLVGIVNDELVDQQELDALVKKVRADARKEKK
ncbi:MAG: BlaI/MecI/CopY family transcriptional regulator [Acidobacteria bacterium]|nr:BlaI/MecI/CopY family transcriptional regulator [Acidobacteriota bacterium]MBV9070659.1 BlaI/MecI/CopY family transcriptional regulator [Acidobacteriota bacterium]MBV9478154.1 BlaI/MecI/CopY family transcriptional regulator [Acidobacteriota bacterium]